MSGKHPEAVCKSHRRHQDRQGNTKVERRAALPPPASLGAAVLCVLLCVSKLLGCASRRSCRSFLGKVETTIFGVVFGSRLHRLDLASFMESGKHGFNDDFGFAVDQDGGAQFVDVSGFSMTCVGPRLEVVEHIRCSWPCRCTYACEKARVVCEERVGVRAPLARVLSPSPQTSWPVSATPWSSRSVPAVAVEATRSLLVRWCCLRRGGGKSQPRTAQEDSIPLSNVKRLFQMRYELDLSETALGYAKLSEMLQDARLRDVCAVRLRSGTLVGVSFVVGQI